MMKIARPIRFTNPADRQTCMDIAEYCAARAWTDMLDSRPNSGYLAVAEFWASLAVQGQEPSSNAT